LYIFVAIHIYRTVEKFRNPFTEIKHIKTIEKLLKDKILWSTTKWQIIVSIATFRTRRRVLSDLFFFHCHVLYLKIVVIDRREEERKRYNSKRIFLWFYIYRVDTCQLNSRASWVKERKKWIERTDKDLRNSKRRFYDIKLLHLIEKYFEYSDKYE
jgi:hypothetical protein